MIAFYLFVPFLTLLVLCNLKVENMGLAIGGFGQYGDAYTAVVDLMSGPETYGELETGSLQFEITPSTPSGSRQTSISSSRLSSPVKVFPRPKPIGIDSPPR